MEHRLRRLCLDLPEATERLSHGVPAFFAGRQFAILWMEGHHAHQFAHLWCAAPAGAQSDLIATDPERYFFPPYVGTRGWVGIGLEGDVDWDDVATLLEDAYRCVASKRQLSLLDAAGRA